MAIEIVATHTSGSSTRVTLARTYPHSLMLLFSAMQQQCNIGELKKFEVYQEAKLVGPSSFSMDPETYPDWMYPSKWSEQYSVSGLT